MIYGPGFYKYDGRRLLYGASVVYGPTYTLDPEQRDSYTFPVDGWSWFDRPEDAVVAFSLPVQGVQTDGSLTPIEFMDRFTEQEQLAITGAAMQSPALRLWYDRLLATPAIHLDNERVIAGVNALVEAALLTEQRADEVLKR